MRKHLLAFYKVGKWRDNATLRKFRKLKNVYILELINESITKDIDLRTAF